MDVFKIDQSMGGLGSGSRVTESSRHHQVTTEVSFDTTSDFNLSFFDSSSTPPTPPAVQTTGASSSSSSTSSSGVVLKEEYDEPSPPPQDGSGSGGVFDALGSDGCIFNSPAPTTPQSPSSVGLDATPDSGVKIKSEFDVANSFSSPHRAPPPRPSLNLFPPPKTGSNPPPTPPSTPITLKNGKSCLLVFSSSSSSFGRVFTRQLRGVVLDIDRDYLASCAVTFVYETQERRLTPRLADWSGGLCISVIE